MALTNTGSNALLLRLQALGLYLGLGLSSSVPQNDGTGFVEPEAGRGYGRINIANVVTIPSGGSFTTNADAYYSENINSDWGVIRYFGIFTAETGGNLLMWGQLTSDVSVTIAHIPVFRAGGLTISLR